MDMICIDSNALTYLIQAISPEYDTKNYSCKVLEQQLAILRIFFYGGKQYYITPTVEAEYKKINIELKKEQHERISQFLLLDHPWEIDATILKARTGELLNYHYRQKNDCQIVAEAELAGICVLLTRDDDLKDNLASRTNVKIYYPSEYWEYLGIPQGTEPKQQPHESNHLSKVDWWRW